MDLSTMSTEELQRLRAQSRSQSQPQAPASGGLTGMSTEQLMQMRGTAQPAPSSAPAFSGGILPFSRAQDGSVSFDSNAGIVGAIKRAVTLPGDVVAGKVDPMSDEAIERSFELGTIATPANPAIRAGSAAIPGWAGRGIERPRVTPPTGEELKAIGGAGFDAVREMGVDYSGQAVSGMVRGLKTQLEQDGLLAEVAPTTHSILNKLVNPPEGSVVTIQSLNAAKQALRAARQNFTNPNERIAAERLIRGMEDFVENVDPRSVMDGPATEAGRLTREARQNYAAGKRSERVTGVGESAELRANVANSGQNLDNAIRSRVASVLEQPKKRQGFSREEIGALDETARGTPTRNATRYVGNLFGGGGGLGAAVTGSLGAGAGALAGGAPGAVAGGLLAAMTGTGAKQIGNMLTRRSLNKADELVRKRSPEYERMLAETPMQAISPTNRAAIARALMLSSPQAAGTSDPTIDLILQALGRN
jgi:hypothetical protein